MVSVSAETDSGPSPLAPELIVQLRDRLPNVAAVALTAVVREVPEYGATLTAEMASDVQREIGAALGAFLALVERDAQGVDASAPIAAGRQGAYALGRGEARAGRTSEALLAAYRVGARVCWRELSSAALGSPTPPAAATMATFAELVFAYIDELSAASIAGHADELAATGRLRARRLAELARALVVGATPEVLVERAEQAGWVPPRTLTAVLLPGAVVHGTLPHLDVRTLQATADEADLPDADTVLLLVPDLDGGRTQLAATLDGSGATIGTTHAWTAAATSVELAVRAARLLGDDEEVTDAERDLAALVVGADTAAHAALVARALGPLHGEPAGKRDRLTATLRAWLLHQGRRGDVAAALQVHPQTVRYRMAQVQELLGDALDDPRTVEALVVALALPARDGRTGPGTATA